MIGADNQQATPRKWESPQRLCAKYPINKICGDEATLLGILYTDGCLSKKSKNCWRFYLSNTSFEIIQTFKDCMVNLFDLDSQRIRISEKTVNGKPFYKELVNYISSGSIIPILLEKENAISDLRELIGNTDPAKAAPDTIRRNFALSITENSVHASDSEKSFDFESKFFFKNKK